MDHMRNSRPRKQNAVAEGLLLGALTAGAVYLGYKNAQESKKQADTLLDVSRKEDNDDHLDLTIRDVPKKLFLNAAQLLAGDIANSTIWLRLLPGTQTERHEILCQTFLEEIEKSGNNDLFRCILSRKHRKKESFLKIMAIFHMSQDVKSCLSFFNTLLLHTPQDDKENVIEFAKFLERNLELLGEGERNVSFILNFHVDHKANESFGSRISSAVLNSQLDSAESEKIIFVVACDREKEAFYKDHGFQTKAKKTFPELTPQTLANQNLMQLPAVEVFFMSK